MVKQMGRPRINRGYKMVRVDIDTHERLKKLADGISLSEYLRELTQLAVNTPAFDDLSIADLAKVWVTLNNSERNQRKVM